VGTGEWDRDWDRGRDWGLGTGGWGSEAGSRQRKAESRQPIVDSLDWGMENREPRQRLFLQPGCFLTYFL